MRRYVVTFLLLLALLAVGGLAVVQFASPRVEHRGAYVPTITSPDQALLLVAGLGAILLLTIGLGVFLAISSVRITRMLHAKPGTLAPSEAAARPSGPKAPAKGEGLDIPLSSNRSVTIFWVVVAVLVIAFQVLRLWGQPIGYLAGLRDLARIEVFRLPGQHIEGLPAFIAGPGDPVTALHVFIAVLIGSIVTVAVVGVLLARGFARLDTGLRTADQLKPTLPDRLIPAVERRIAALRQPRTRRVGGNPIDSLLTGVSVVLLLIIAGIVAFMVVPAFRGVAQVDRDLKATELAALATATPEGAAGATPAGTGQAQAMQEAFSALPAGDAAAGEQIFNTGTAPACTTCHSLQPNQVVVGPSLAGAGTRAATRREGYSAEAYLFEAVKHPGAFIAPGFPNAMPATIADTLSDQQLADLLAFLLAEK